MPTDASCSPSAPPPNAADCLPLFRRRLSEPARTFHPLSQEVKPPWKQKHHEFRPVAFTGTKPLYPDRISLENGQASVTKHSLLGLGRPEEVMSTSRISSLGLESGIFNATIVVETQGGATSDMWVETLPKSPAEALTAESRAQLPPQATDSHRQSAGDGPKVYRPMRQLYSLLREPCCRTAIIASRHTSSL